MAYNFDMAIHSLPPVPSIKKRSRVSMKMIRSIARHIAERFDPDAIILFGSHAYGAPDAHSDVDLLVVMDTPNGEMEAMVEIAKSLPISGFGVDVVVRSRQTLERRKKLGDWFLREITEKGKVLYERTDARMAG